MISAASSVVAALLAARVAGAADTSPPEITHQACGPYRLMEDFEVRADIRDASGLFDPKVIYRSKATPGWRNTPLVQRGKYWVGRIPASDLLGPLDYFVETFDLQGNGPTRIGSAEVPLRVLGTDAAVRCEQFPGDPGPGAATTNGAVNGGRATSQPSDKQVEPAKAAAAAKTTGAASAGTEQAAPAAAPGRCAGEERPLWCEPWLWALAGGIVVAGAVGIGVGVSVAGQPTPRDSVPVVLLVPALEGTLVSW